MSTVNRLLFGFFIPSFLGAGVVWFVQVLALGGDGRWPWPRGLQLLHALFPLFYFLVPLVKTRSDIRKGKGIALFFDVLDIALIFLSFHYLDMIEGERDAPRYDRFYWVFAGIVVSALLDNLLVERNGRNKPVRLWMIGIGAAIATTMLLCGAHAWCYPLGGSALLGLLGWYLVVVAKEHLLAPQAPPTVAEAAADADPYATDTYAGVLATLKRMEEEEERHTTKQMAVVLVVAVVATVAAFTLFGSTVVWTGIDPEWVKLLVIPAIGFLYMSHRSDLIVQRRKRLFASLGATAGADEAKFGDVTKETLKPLVDEQLKASIR